MTLLGQRNSAGTKLPVLTRTKRTKKRRRRRSRKRMTTKSKSRYGLHRASGVL